MTPSRQSAVRSSTPVTPPKNLYEPVLRQKVNPSSSKIKNEENQANKVNLSKNQNQISRKSLEISSSRQNIKKIIEVEKNTQKIRKATPKTSNTITHTFNPGYQTKREQLSTKLLQRADSKQSVGLTKQT